MYSTLLFFHSIFRWLVLASLLYAIFRGARGWPGKKPFTKADNFWRHTTATIAHVQLAIGCVLYFTSPVTRYFLSDSGAALQNRDVTFFGLIHLLMMLTAITGITIGSSLAKRKHTDREKFRTMTIWFTAALLIILAAIPWPFSPLAVRLYFRPF